MSKTTKASSAIRLSDTQLIALSAASQRDDGVISISDRLKGAAAQKFISTLIEKGLAREVRAKLGGPIARRDPDGRAFALVVTKKGQAAIHADNEKGRATSSQKSSKTESAKTAAAVKASGPRPLGDSAGPARPTKERSLEAKGDNRPREGTKLAAVIALLVRPDGASLDELIAPTQWLPHTTRAALTGLRKRGYAVERRRIEGKTRYAIAASHKAKAA
jgi:Protein of unknown function (DUF3489)